jgi:hypothetical protein
MIGTAAELAASLEIVSEQLHPTFDGLGVEQSRTSCVHASLAVRDYLRELGLAAEALPVALVIRAIKAGEQSYLHSIGSEHHERPAPKWKGHMITVCNGVLIDATFCQFRTDAIPNMPDMIAAPTTTGTALGLNVLASVQGKIAPDHAFAFMWLHTPKNQGWRAWDTKPKREVRHAVVRELLRQHAKRHGHDATARPQTSDPPAPLSIARRT